MSNMHWLGIILFAVLLYKTAAPFKTKLNRLRLHQEGAVIDFIFMSVAIIMCLWAIGAIFLFPH